MQASAKEISKITSAEIVELRSLDNPPEPVKLVMNSLLVLFDEEPVGWDAARDFLKDPNFKSRLTEFDCQGVSDDVIAHVEEYTYEKFYDPNNIFKYSLLGAKIAHWILCTVEYAKMCKMIAERNQ
jgi:hypothetical protein